MEFFAHHNLQNIVDIVISHTFIFPLSKNLFN